MEKSQYKLFKIEDGTVIDHIPSAKGLAVYKILSKTNDGSVSIGLNFDSQKHGKKAIIKYENKKIDKTDTDKISLIAPEATINIISNGQVVEKRKIDIPTEIKGILKCVNPNCITNVESLETQFTVTDHSPVKVMCRYCERIMEVKTDMINKS